MRRAWSALATSVVVALVAGVLAGLAYGAWSSRHPNWESTTSFSVSPLPGTGDPDRLIATQMEVLKSRTQREAVAKALADPASFTIGAEQRRLSDVVDVTVTSPKRATATRAAAVLERTYPARAGGATAPMVRVTVLDSPQEATRADDVALDAALVSLGGAVLTAAAFFLLYSLRPRVKRSYEVAPVDAVVLELPAPGRRGSSRRTEAAAELRRLAGHVIAADDEVRPQVSALPGVDATALGWVTEVLGSVSADVADSSGAGKERPLTVLVARAGVDTERVLRKEARSSAVFSDVMVVLLGAARPALVVPAPDADHARDSGDADRSLPHRSSRTVWR